MLKQANTSAKSVNIKDYFTQRPSATNFYVQLFADDTFLCAQNTNAQLLEDEANLEISKDYQWLVTNKLTLNVSKSKFMIVTNKKCFKSDFSVSIDKTPFENCNTYKHLGVMIDRNLN